MVEMRRGTRHWVGCLLVAGSLGTVPAQSEPTQTGPTAVELLPTGADWIVHLTRDLMPFWTMPEALGAPVGFFPTNRYSDGSLIDPDGELREGLEEWEKEFDGVRDLMRMTFGVPISRQTYTYCAAYHMTGDERLLEMAKAGVDFLLGEGRDENGIPFTRFVGGVGGPGPGQRTAQEMSYMLLGPSMYYYLTGDPEVLEGILPVRDYIFEHYGGGDDWRHLRWCDEAFSEADGETSHNPETIGITAHLDQINAYMLLLAPVVPAHLLEGWRRDLGKLVDVLVEEFYSPEHNVFWGGIGQPDSLGLGTSSTDFGHTVKSFWLIWLAARELGDEERASFAAAGARKLFDEAFLPDVGAWGMQKEADGSVNRNRLWWSYAELDQAAATFGLLDPTIYPYLNQTYRYWMRKFIDRRNGEVWAWIPDETDEPMPWKVWQWKSGFHSVEHSLVGYITAQAARQQPVTLYYAFADAGVAGTIHPYYFRGNVRELVELDSGRREGGKVQQVTFTDVH